jgi:acyl carrier protein
MPKNSMDKGFAHWDISGRSLASVAPGAIASRGWAVPGAPGLRSLKQARGVMVPAGGPSRMIVTREFLLDFLRETGRVDPASIQDDTPLFTSSRLDSFLLVELIVHLESTLGIQFPPEDITLDNLDSLRDILAYLAKRQE